MLESNFFQNVRHKPCLLINTLQTSYIHIIIVTYLDICGFYSASSFINSVELLNTHSGLFVPISQNDAIKTHLLVCVKAGNVPVFMETTHILCLDNSYKPCDYKRNCIPLVIHVGKFRCFLAFGAKRTSLNLL